MSKGFASSYRLVLLAGGLLLCFGALATRLVWLHVIDHDELVRPIAKARWQMIPDPARRGDIYDTHGALLATSDSLIVLGVDPSWLRKPNDKLRERDEKKWPQLAALIGMPLPELRTIFTTKYREPTPASAAAPVAVPAGLVFNFTLPSATPETKAASEDADETDALAAAPASDDLALGSATDAAGRREIQWVTLRNDLPESTYDAVVKLGIQGVYGFHTYRRIYPHGKLAAHVLGFLNRQQKPVTGAERSADFYLRGQDGWREGERDGRSNELAQFRTRVVPKADGYSVVLSIDTNVQDIVEQELAAIAQKYQPLKATIIVSDPRTGFILGLGNYPSFDPNEFYKVPKEEVARLKNIAVTDIYEPGSVFKIVAASGALEDGIVTPDSTFDCTLASVMYQGTRHSFPTVRKLPAEDKSDHFDHPLTVAEIIAHSSNKGAAQLAMRLGDERFYNYARGFGFGQRTGLPGGHEEAGLMKAPANWDDLTITRMPMGQGVAVTVMQMHQAMSVIASGGALLRPQLVQEIRDPSGESVSRFGRAEERRVISERTARTMARLLAGVASKDGNAATAAIPGYEVAGKTGTAQKIIDGHYSTTHHVASFIGFFPASRPQVAISVIIDDADARAPGGVAYGAKTAAPAFKHIGEQLIPLLKIEAVRPATSNLIALEGGRR